MRLLVLLLFLALLVFCCGNTYAQDPQDQETCDVLGMAIARNFCVAIPDKMANTATLVPDPVSADGLTGISCRFGLWLEKLIFQLASLCMVEQVKAVEHVETSHNIDTINIDTINTPKLAPPQICTVDVTIGNKNIISVPIEIEKN